MRRRARGEDGATLMLALAFLLLFSLVIAALLVQAGTNMKTTTTVVSHGSKLYAADGGIDFGIQKVRATASLCPDVPAGQQDVGDVSLNGRTVHVTCKTLSGDNGTGDLGGGGTFGQAGWTTVATGWGTAAWSTTKARCNSASTPNDLGSTIQVIACAGAGATPRTITDGVLTTAGGPGSPNKKLTSPSQAHFVAADVGATLSGPGIPAGTSIKTLISPTQVTMNNAATQAGTNLTIQIGGQQAVTFGGTKVFNAGGFNISPGLNGIVQGSISQYNTSPSNYCTRDQTAAHYPSPNDANPHVGGGWLCTTSGATVVPDPAPHVVVPPNLTSRTIVANTTNMSKTVTSATANFTQEDAGATITGAGIDPNGTTTIATVTNATTIQISKNAKQTLTGTTLTITQPGAHAKTTGTGACASVNYLYPGRYLGTKPAWGGNTYFASGVYYIEDTGETALDGNLNIGGEPGPHDPRFVDLGGLDACYTDAAADAACGGCLPADPGKGITFIIGGTTLLDIHGGLNEMFTRVPGTMDATATPGTTIFAMADAAGLNLVSGGDYKLSLTTGADRCNCAFVTDNSGQQIIFHGLTYSPYEPVDVFNNAGVNYSPFYGGLVANWIVARVDSGSQSGLFTGQFGAIGGPSMRTILITATAPGTAQGEVSIVSKALVTVDVDTNKTTTVQTWRNQ